MTDKERMLSGENFRTGAPELMHDKAQARTKANEYNSLPEEEGDKREELLRGIFGHCGKGAFIKPPFHCDYGYQISVGDRFFANFDCVFLDGGKITIGNDVMIGPKTCIYAITHPKDASERAKGIGIPRDVTIGDNVWIGGGVTILPGVTIGSRSVIGAGSVVTHDVPPDTVAAGNPAKIIETLS